MKLEGFNKRNSELGRMSETDFSEDMLSESERIQRELEALGINFEENEKREMNRESVFGIDQEAARMDEKDDLQFALSPEELLANAERMVYESQKQTESTRKYLDSIFGDTPSMYETNNDELSEEENYSSGRRHR